MAEVAVAGQDERVKRAAIPRRQQIPVEFLESVLLALKHAGIVQSQRGAGGVFRLARRASEISLADVIRAVDGPSVSRHGHPLPPIYEARAHTNGNCCADLSDP